jgi:hypothetical protein
MNLGIRQIGSGTISIILGIRQTGVFPSQIIDYYIEIQFPEPLPEDITISFKGEWTSQKYEALKDLELSEVFFNPYYPPKGHEDMIINGKRRQREKYERLKAEERERDRIREARNNRE